MKKIIITICLLLNSCTIFNSNYENSQLFGEWLLEGGYDCPDMIEFKNNGVYIIYNDCGAENPRLPIVENGQWSLKNNYINLYNRDIKNIHSDFSQYHGKQDKLILKLKEASENKLLINYINEDNILIEESYIKNHHHK